MPSREPDPGGGDDRTPGPPTAAVRLIAAAVVCVAAYFLATILAPFLLALVLAIAFAPLAGRIERTGLGRSVSSLACLLIVAAAISGAVGLIGYQTGGIARDAVRYADRLGDLAARVVRSVGGEGLLLSIVGEGEERASADPGAALVDQAKAALSRDARSLGRVAALGLGGLLGLVGQAAVFLAFFFFMLQGRAGWIDRLRRAARAMGMRPKDREFGQVAGQLSTYLGTVALVSLAYLVVISLALWGLGVPQPLLWGVLTAILEVVPYFGPVVAGTLPALASLGAGEQLWRPAAVVALFAILQTVEGYVVAPLLYGKAVDIEPVTVLIGVMFFGVLLGPAGLALAMPLMILLRGVLFMTPDTPALDALAEAEAE